MARNRVNGYFGNKYINRKGEVITINTSIDNEKWEQLINQAIPKILKMNEEKSTLPILAWFLVSIFKEPIFEVNKQKKFPILNVCGDTGTAKSLTVQFINYLLGGDELNSRGMTHNSLINKISETNAFPLVIDDYDFNRDDENLLQLVKLPYSSTILYQRNVELTTDEYTLSAPICVISQKPIYEEGIKIRSINVEMSNTWIRENRQEVGKLADELNNIDLSYFLDGYLKFALELIDSGRFEIMYKSADSRVSEFLKENKELTIREILALNVISIGIGIIKELLKTANSDYEITDEDYKEVFKHCVN